MTNTHNHAHRESEAKMEKSGNSLTRFAMYIVSRPLLVWGGWGWGVGRV